MSHVQREFSEWEGAALSGAKQTYIRWVLAEERMQSYQLQQGTTMTCDLRNIIK